MKSRSPPPANVHDLDEYRRRRIKEGTWPPGGQEDLVGYWREFVAQKKGTKPEPKK